jgi:hypothetical protein
MQYAPLAVVKVVFFATSILGIGLGVKEQDVTSPLSPLILIVPLLLLLVFWTPFRVWQRTQERVDALEDARTPKLNVRCDKLDAFSQPQQGVILVVTNDGLDEVEECYAQVNEILLECDFPNSEPHIDYVAQHKNEDIYLRWRNKDANQPRHSFRSSASVDVVLRTEGGGRLSRYVVSAVGNNEPYQLMRGGTYFLTIEIGAKNSAPKLGVYRLWVPQGDADDPILKAIEWGERPRPVRDNLLR